MTIYTSGMPLSKERLRRAGLDADEIIPGLWQGSIPPKGATVKLAGFDVLVLCAEEYQPRSIEFGAMRVVHAPLDDHARPLSESEWRMILGASEIVADQLRRGRRVLVTCAMGRNRSGIVTALAIMLVTGCRPSRAIRVVRGRRKDALTNLSFTSQLQALV